MTATAQASHYRIVTWGGVEVDDLIPTLSDAYDVAEGLLRSKGYKALTIQAVLTDGTTREAGHTRRGGL